MRIPDYLQRGFHKIDVPVLRHYFKELLVYLWLNKIGVPVSRSFGRYFLRGFLQGRVIGAFPNQDSLLRLTVSILIDINEDWLTGKRYLPMAEE